MSEVVVIIRPSFKKVCGPDACRAALYNHILFRLARKAKDEPEKKVRAGEIFWYASAEDICKDIDEAWCVNKVRKEIKQLVTDRLLGQRHNPLKGFDRKFQYFLSPKEGRILLQKAREQGVCLLHMGLNAEVLHLLHMVNAFDKNGGCICQKEEMDLPDMADAFTTFGRAIPEESTKGSTKTSETEEGESAAPAQTPARTSSAELLSESAKLKAIVTAGINRFGLSDEDCAPDLSDEDETVKRQTPPETQAASLVQTTYRQVGKNGVRSATFDDIVQAQNAAHSQQTPNAPADPPGSSARPSFPTADGADRNRNRGDGPRASGARFHVPARPQRPQHERPKMEKPQLTLEGSQVKGWLEDIWGTTISLRAGNIKDLNDLGALPDASRESLDATITFLEAKKWVKDNDIAIGLHILAGNEKNLEFLSFENNWQSARRKKHPPRKSETLADGKTSSIYAI